MATTLDSDADPTYTHFGHRDEFFGLLGRLLDLDLQRLPTGKQEEDEVKLVDQMGEIVCALADSSKQSPRPANDQLDYYMPLPGLLDPSLYDIVNPLMDKLIESLTTLAHDPSAEISGPRLRRLGRILNWTVKVRGWKAIGERTIEGRLITSSSFPLRHSQFADPDHPLISSIMSELIQNCDDSASPSFLWTRSMGAASGAAAVAGVASYRSVQPDRSLARIPGSSPRHRSSITNSLRSAHFRARTTGHITRSTFTPSTRERRGVRCSRPSQAVLASGHGEVIIRSP